MPYRRLTQIILPLLASGFLLSGCASECEKLADSVCDRFGKESAACKNAMDRLETSREDDERLCSQALKLTKQLTPSN